MTFRYPDGQLKLQLLQGGKVIKEGHPADIREKIEEMFQAKFDFCPDFQESEVESKDDEYFVYLHTEGCDELDDEQIEQLDEHNISEDDEETTKVLKTMFNIDFKILG